MSLNSFLSKIFGNKSQRDLKEIKPTIDKINAIGPTLKDLTNDELRGKIQTVRDDIAAATRDDENAVAELKAQIEDLPFDKRQPLWDKIDEHEKHILDTLEEKLNEHLPIVFATMRETAARFSANEIIEVTATDLDRRLAVEGHDFVSIDGDKAIWKNKWMAGGNEIALKEIPAGVSQIVNVDAAQHVHPRLFPHITGMSDIAFLAGILLLFAGVEVHAVHAPELAKPQTQFPRAMFLAALISFGLFTLGALAVAIITPYDQINLQSGLFTTFQIAFERYHVGWLSNVMGLLVAFGALAGVMSWISGPSRGLLWTAQEGVLPCFLQKTNKNGVQVNILIIQGCIVTLLSSLYIVMDDVSVAFFLLSALTVGLYLVMYMMMYAAAIRLRYTQPGLQRDYRVPGGNAGMWAVGGIGFLAVLFSFAVTFFPPSQLPVGSPAIYTTLVVCGTALFLAVPIVISIAMDRRRGRGPRT